MKLRDFGAIILLGSIWGASYLFIKLGVAVMPPATFVLGRVVIAGLVSLTILRARGMPLPKTRAVWATFAVMGLLNGAIPYTLIMVSVAVAATSRLGLPCTRCSPPPGRRAGVRWSSRTGRRSCDSHLARALSSASSSSRMVNVTTPSQANRVAWGCCI